MLFPYGFFVCAKFHTIAKKNWNFCCNSMIKKTPPSLFFNRKCFFRNCQISIYAPSREQQIYKDVQKIFTKGWIWSHASFYLEPLHKCFQWVQQLPFFFTHLGQLRLKIMTLGPSHKLDGEEEISLGRPELLFKYGKFTSSLFHCTSDGAKRWKWKWHRNLVILLPTRMNKCLQASCGRLLERYVDAAIVISKFV